MARGTVNKVIILGRLGQDPDVRATASGTQVVNLNVATNEFGPQDDQGNRQEQTEWHRIVIFGRMAETAANYLHKGSLVYIEGRLQTRKWQDQNGQDRYSTEIVAREMQFVGGRSEGGQGQGGGGFGGGQSNQGGSFGGQPQGGFGGQQNSGGFGGGQSNQGGGFGGGQPAPSQPAPQTGSQPGNNNFDDFDDDIPF
ncbi:single-stranded DNA-binding protein [Saccharospirillum mangrovi]|uniref:single-stranded DNA-binding protein n=1 Tax=Saccharospirillum mangrovi TaxID=2161747 RepID=UPI000D3B1074|nr:single-stranded DNA-binding protein [Saccharospirillum mangrovi]